MTLGTTETELQGVSLFLVDDHGMFREGLARVLEREPGFTVAGQSASVTGALGELPMTASTIVLLDVDLGAERAIDFVIQAKRRGFPGKILVLTAGVSGLEAVQLVQSGVAGILHKHHSTKELCEAIRQVAGGEACLEPNYLSPLFRTVDRTHSTTQPRLTERDKTVLRFVFQGLTNKEIATRLDVSEGAVKASLRQLFEKLKVRNRAQLVKIALEQYRDQL
jgi:DNA-binding NarL/FixJ family response regulator